MSRVIQMHAKSKKNFGQNRKKYERDAIRFSATSVRSGFYGSVVGTFQFECLIDFLEFIAINLTIKNLMEMRGSICLITRIFILSAEMKLSEKHGRLIHTCFHNVVDHRHQQRQFDPNRLLI